MAFRRIAVVDAVLLLVLLLLLPGCRTGVSDRCVNCFVTSHVEKVASLSAGANLAYWEAAISGSPEKFDEWRNLQLQIRRVYSDRGDFAFLKAAKEKGQMRDLRLSRQVEKLYYAYLQNQIAPELTEQLVELDTSVQETYNNYRGSIDGKKVTMSDIYLIMTTEQDCRKRELAWRASKEVGNVIIEDFLRLVKLRNRAARSLGFDNYHTMLIVTGEQDVAQLDDIFEELDSLTAEPFIRLKAELDKILAEGYGIEVDELLPWHYHDPFFQRTPLVYELDLDSYYKGRDIEDLARRYYASIGLPANDILGRSDLYDRKGKYPHAFSHDIDRSGDVRILCNLQDTERWAETILHELGHAVYSKYHDVSEPWLLREPAHSFTTEAVAMLFGRLSRNAAWMKEMLDLSSQQQAEIEEISSKYLRFQQVLFARWDMVMYHFEKQLYADPDQDLDTLWWDLVEKYQRLKRPPGPADAGWASKLHFTTAPCYYHNYILGELLASQLHHHIVHDVLGLESDSNVSYVGDERIGDYLRKNVLAPGAKYHWNEMIRRATGEPLTPKFFVEQFVE